MKLYAILAGIFILGFLVIAIAPRFRPLDVKKVGAHVGEVKKIIFTVASTHKFDNGDVVLYPVESTDFYVLLLSHSEGRFTKNPELFYMGKKVRVKGKIEQEDRQYLMRLKHRNEVVEMKN